MEKEFVPFELNEKLIDLGLNNRNNSFGCWVSFYGTNQPDFSKVIKEEFLDYDIFKPAILWQQAFDWFREKHKIHSSIDFVDNTRGVYYDFDLVNSNDREYHDEDMIDQAKRIHTWDKFGTYQEARTACLEKLIELTLNTQHHERRNQK